MKHKHLLMVALDSGRVSELMMTKPKPSFSLRWMTTSLLCGLWGTDPSGGEEPGPGGGALVRLPGNTPDSLFGELWCVDMALGLPPFSGQRSPEVNKVTEH